jgi:hypothetical protein
MVKERKNYIVQHSEANKVIFGLDPVIFGLDPKTNGFCP